jgi:hypothetical protein
MSSKKILNMMLIALCGYFCAMSLAHFTEFKVPLLFIYYDVPSTPYQNQIISFCAFSYAAFAYAALRNLSTVPSFLVAMAGVVFGLAGVNLSYKLRDAIGDASTTAYWIQTALIGAIVVVLVVLYSKARKA